MSNGRMLLAHEWIASIGGSENVFRELLDTFPDADAVCLWNDVPTTFDRPISESRLASSRLRGHKALSLPFMPWVWRSFDLTGYEAVLASSHAFGHHLARHAVQSGVPAFAYVHTPARYIWAPEVEVRGQGLAARLGSVPLKRVDRASADPRVNYAANSGYIKERIRRSWDVDATVIYPPVDVERITAVRRWRDELSVEENHIFDALPGDGYVLGASRLVSYKRLDKAIEVGQALNLPVVIAGSGPDENALRHQALRASVPVHFVGRVSDAQLFTLYQEASLFVFMAIEDFGIMPVECMATGTPVLVSAQGGAKESVHAVGRGGEVDVDASTAELARRAEQAIASSYSASVSQFSRARFAIQIADWVAQEER